MATVVIPRPFGLILDGPAPGPAPTPPQTPLPYPSPALTRSLRRDILAKEPRANVPLLVRQRTAVGLGPVTLRAVFTGVVRQTFESASPQLRFRGLVRQDLLGGLNIGPLKFASLVRETLASAPPSPGPIPVFPTLPQGFPVKVDVVLDTIIGTTKSLREVRVAMQQFPLWDIEIRFEELRDQTQNQTKDPQFVGYTQYMTLVQLWLSMYGQAGIFAFDCPWDDSRLDQPIGTGDGSTYKYTIIRTWGTGALATAAPVGLVNTITNVKVGGVAVSTLHYRLDRNKISFLNTVTNIPEPPAPGASITMTFSYYYLCRFVADEQEWEEFAKNRYTVPSLKFRAVVWP